MAMSTVMVVTVIMNTVMVDTNHMVMVDTNHMVMVDTKDMVVTVDMAIMHTVMAVVTTMVKMMKAEMPLSLWMIHS